MPYIPPRPSPSPAAAAAMVLAALAGKAQALPPAFFLAGDSTTAVDGGWGNGFLATLDADQGAWGVNIGHSGATTKSFVEDGDWANITAHVEEYVGVNDVYVTISFGHNDQKEDSGVDQEQFLENLINFGTEIIELGGVPLYTTSLTRRNFPSGEPNNADDSLHDERLLAIEASEAVSGSYVVDLNENSLWYINQIGEDEAHRFNYEDGDNTHLNPWGETVFGRMVSDLVVEAVPGVGAYVVANQTMSDLIWAGLPADLVE